MSYSQYKHIMTFSEYQEMLHSQSEAEYNREHAEDDQSVDDDDFGDDRY